MKTLAVVLAGGSGSRFLSDRPKQFTLLGGKAVLCHSAEVFDSSPAVDALLIVSHPDHQDEVKRLTASLHKLVAVIDGGQTRTDSSVAAVTYAAEHGFDRILLHDAARPLINHDLVSRLCDSLQTADAVVAAIPVVDTVSISEDGETIQSTPSRDTLYAIQTPQAFSVPIIAKAYRLLTADQNAPLTDDAGVIRRYLPHIPVRLVAGCRSAHKLTHPEDLLFLEAMLAKGGEA